MKKRQPAFQILFFSFLGIMGLNAFLQYQRLEQIRDSWSLYQKNIHKKERIISNLKGAIGYGGAIHKFKNYLLRKNPSDLLNAKESFLKTQGLITEYRTSSLINPEEQSKIDIINKTFQTYSSHLDFLQKNQFQRSIVNLDKQVRVDDKPTIAAFDWLEKNLKKERDQIFFKHQQTVNTASISLVATLSFSMLFFGLVFFYVRKKLIRARQKQEEQESKLKLHLNQQEVLIDLLKVPVSSEIPLKEKLTFAIEKITTVHWIALLDRAGIFLTESDSLKLFVSKNLGDKVESVCAVIDRGRCLCGRAFDTQKTVHAACVDERHENRFEGIRPHGHYNVPILAEKKVVGVLVVYLPHGHKKRASEVSFLETCTDVIGSMILAHRTELNLIQAKNEALEATKTKTQFLANMSHEIRTPMNGIIGMSNLLFDSVKDPSDVKKLEVIQSCGKSLLNIINDILDFSKLELDGIELELRPYPLHKTVYQVIELLHSQASEKDLSLHYEPKSDLPAWIKGDSTRFRQVLTNLIANAIKFTKVGKITIRSSGKRMKNGTWELEFSVEDSGIGIPDHVKSKLFRSFSQVDASTTRKFGGTGLGLAISKSLCEKMGGTMWFESHLNQGSIFYFTLKAEETEERREVEKSTDLVKKFDSKMAEKYPLQILVVEDNKTNQLIIENLLAKLGYQIDLAENGKEALGKVNQRFYHLIFMDCHMPIMDGFEATQAILKKYKNQPSPRIVALTASVMKEEVDRCHQAGMEDVVAKPITITALVKSIKNYKQEGIDFEKTFSEPNSGESPFNEEQFFLNFQGMEDLARESVASFLEFLPELMLKIEKAITSNDPEALELSAHTLKGAASNFYAEKTVSLAKELELLGNSKTLNGANSIFTSLKEEITKLTLALNKLLDQENQAA